MDPRPRGSVFNASFPAVPEMRRAPCGGSPPLPPSASPPSYGVPRVRRLSPLFSCQLSGQSVEISGHTDSTPPSCERIQNQKHGIFLCATFWQKIFLSSFIHTCWKFFRCWRSLLDAGGLVSCNPPNFSSRAVSFGMPGTPGHD